MINLITFFMYLFYITIIGIKVTESKTSFSSLYSPLLSNLRGGSTTLSSPSNASSSSSSTKDVQKLIQNYKLQQQHLLQLRSTFLSEALATRGIHVGPTMMDVSTPEGNKPPQEVDWDCCLSTVDDPKTCLYSFDAEPNTKVISPIGTTQYISLTALNRLRRTDPTKVEPMWHSQYAILKSWFDDESQYSIMQYVGFKGFIISTILLDLGKGLVLKALLAFSILSLLVIFSPIIEVITSRILTSSTLWMKWRSWGRWIHAALPLKILIGQMIWKFVAGGFGKLENVVRDYIVDLECSILEESIPVTMSSTTGSMEHSSNDDDDDDDDDDLMTMDALVSDDEDDNNMISEDDYDSDIDE